MEPPAHLRLPPRRDYRVGLWARVSPALLFIVGAVALLVSIGRQPSGDGPVGLLCALVCFGVFAVGILLPVAWQRILGFAELRSTARDLQDARKLIDAGRPDAAAEKLTVTATRIAGRLYAYHVVVAASAGVAHVLAGEVELGLSVLDGLERSGWLRALSLRAFSDGIWASIATLRAISGDVPGAERALGQCRRVPLATSADAVAIARVVVAARRGDDDARAQIAALLASGQVSTVRGRGTLLSIDGCLAHAAGDAAGDAERAREVLALRPRLFAHARAGWPELAGWLSRHGVTDAAAG